MEDTKAQLDRIEKDLAETKALLSYVVDTVEGALDAISKSPMIASMFKL